MTIVQSLLPEALVAEGIAGALVPSFVAGAIDHRDVNLVLWHCSDRLPHQVTVVDDEGRLPHDDRSWR